MLRKKLPRCACMSVVTAVTVPTVLGSLVKVVMNIPTFIKAAQEVYAGINKALEMSKNINAQMNPQPQPQEGGEETVG